MITNADQLDRAQCDEPYLCPLCKRPLVNQACVNMNCEDFVPFWERDNAAKRERGGK